MATRKIEKLPSVQNVSAGSTAALHLPCGMTYDYIDFVLENITLAQMTNIEVRINGKTIQNFGSGTELDTINKYHGRVAFQNGVLRLWFMRPELPTLQIANNGSLVDQRYVTSIGTSDVATFSIHFDISGDCVSPTVTAYAQKSPAAPLGFFTKIKAFPRSYSTTGQQEIDTLPRSGARIAAIHLFKSDVSEVNVEVDSIKVYDVTKTLGEELQKDFGKSPVSDSATHIDFLMNGSLDDALKTYGVQDMRLRPVIDTVGSVRTVVEYLDGYEGI